MRSAFTFPHINVRVIACPLAFIFLLSAAGVYAQTLDVTLKIDDNSNTVYIPASGAGSIPASTLTEQTYTAPSSFYLASIGSEYLLAIVNYAGKPFSLSAKKAGGSHYLTVSQALEGSNTFLVFSKGNQNTIENRLPLLKEGSFLEYATPTFGFGLSNTQLIKMALSYTSIDIEGLDILSSGLHSLVIEKKGTEGGKPVVDVRRG